MQQRKFWRPFGPLSSLSTDLLEKLGMPAVDRHLGQGYTLQSTRYGEFYERNERRRADHGR